MFSIIWYYIFGGNYKIYCVIQKCGDLQRYLDRSLMRDKHLVGLEKDTLAAVKTICQRIYVSVLRALDERPVK